MASKENKECATVAVYDYKFCIVDKELKCNELFMKAVKHFNSLTVFSLTGKEFIGQDEELTTIFILNEFEGEPFESLHAAEQRILGPTVVMQYAKKNEPIPNNIRPLYTASMKNLVITFTGFRKKEDVSNAVAMVHHMGGSIRKDFNMAKTTHLIAISAAKTSEKYRYAVSLGIPIMSMEWIYQTWARRHDVNCSATCEDLMLYKLLPFMGCKLAFLGYQKDEEQHMAEILIKNGGEVVDSKDPSCTHVVVEDRCIIDPKIYERDAYIVKNEWFWACVQMEAKAEEGLYIYVSPNNNAFLSSSHIIPIKGNKRMRVDSVARQLAMESFQEDEIICPDLRKKTELSKLSMSGSFFDVTMSPDKTLENSPSEHTDHNELDRRLKSPSLDPRCLSPRQLVCYELYQTESNYVGILHTIITVFQKPLEDPEQTGGELLAPAEVKIIFGNLLPIYEIHQKIRNELSEVIHSWSDNQKIGPIILNHEQEFKKFYPPFINFFEKTKTILVTCDATKPRFHAFLKRCQSKPECGRQTLQELLIRPVQRLPSVILLLNDILKHTTKNDPDHEALGDAIKSLKNVLLCINEDKRKTDGQVEMFDIVNDIENCPPNLLSSHRSFISKVDVQEHHHAQYTWSKKSGTITLFLFSDVLEICKKRGKATSTTMKSPSMVNITSTMMRAHPKTYKHIELIPLQRIKRVADVEEEDGYKNMFSIVVSSTSCSTEFEMFALTLLSDINKSTFLRSLCQQVANNSCTKDSEILLTSLRVDQLELQESDASGNVITKAFSKTRNKLGRALSIRKTPTKRGLSRAVSTIISPLRNFGTPSSSLNSWRLSSVTNLTKLDTRDDFLSPSPVIGKKRKSSSFSVAAGKLLNH